MEKSLFEIGLAEEELNKHIEWGTKFERNKYKIYNLLMRRIAWTWKQPINDNLLKKTILVLSKFKDKEYFKKQLESIEQRLFVEFEEEKKGLR